MTYSDNLEFPNILNSDREILANAERLWCEEHKVQLVTPSDSHYPQVLLKIPNPPQKLYFWGNPIWNEKKLISIVGSRNPSRNSLEWMENEITELIRKTNCIVVSGGARGIDQKAHQLAIRARQPTIVFVPAGLARLYPRDLNDDVENILSCGGMVVSQFEPFSEMRKIFFHARNRLIAALSPLTLVVEARRRSGTLITARYAKEYDRILASVPTFPTEAGMGGLDLIVEGGAFPVRDEMDLRVLLNFSEVIDRKN